MRRTKAEAQETRSAILDAAEHVFFERGVSQSALSHIASQAGITRGAIYWHFAGKSDLFLAMHERAFLPERAFIESQGLETSAEPLGELHRCALECIQRFASDERAKRVYSILHLRCEYVGEMEAVMNCHRRNEDDMQQIIRKVFERARDLGELKAPWQPGTAVIACVGTFTGLITEWLRAGEDFDIRETGKLMLDALFAGFGSVRGFSSGATTEILASA
ncbi:TetR family transcriptional regulator [Aureimonas sp. ME7]|uniref:TetR family transcriptional regulator n=1 Tax=Aureimonas sp. ME7 TaxID=2744252 RepID=UPI0015F5889D|nr:TetR family transcriptional regulator [Aureimonas sp. ME7]